LRLCNMLTDVCTLSYSSGTGACCRC
jgi:hypothetical protein